MPFLKWLLLLKKRVITEKHFLDVVSMPNVKDHAMLQDGDRGAVEVAPAAMGECNACGGAAPRIWEL